MNDRIDPIDPITAAVAIASILFGPTMSAIIGPYAVIILGATAGASWALGRSTRAAYWEPDDRPAKEGNHANHHS